MYRQFFHIPAALVLAIAGQSLALAQQPQPAPRPPSKAPVAAPAATPQPAPATTDGPKADPRRFGVAQPIAKPAGTIRLAAYNLENMFDDKDDPALTGDKDDKDQTKPESQRRALGDTIHRVNPDILCVEEIESLDALLWFRDQFLSDMGYAHVVSIDAGDDRGIEQSVLSRFPLTDAKNWVHLPLGGVHPDKAGRDVNPSAGKPILYHRSPLRVTAQVPSSEPGGAPYALTIFVVHQKSGEGWEFWREKEAAKTAELVGEIQKADPNRNIAIVGDFNAVPGSPSLKVYSDAGLVDAFADALPSPLPKKPDPMYITHESGKILDHILMNPALVHEFKRETRFILGTPARPADVDWRRATIPEGYASDHYPVVVDLVPSDR